MTPLQLLAILNENLTANTVLKPVKRLPQKPKKDKSYTHYFYDLSHLERLTNELLKLGKSYDYDERYSVRYLVESDGRIVFAREGRPGKYIPGHKQISTRCLAAGNIYFNADYSKVIKINHESGDFHPPIGTLIHPLTAILSTSPHILSDSLEVEVKITPSSDPEVIKINKEDLMACLEENYSRVKASNTPWESVKNVSFIDSHQTVRSRPQATHSHHKRAKRFHLSELSFETEFSRV